MHGFIRLAVDVIMILSRFGRSLSHYSLHALPRGSPINTNFLFFFLAVFLRFNLLNLISAFVERNNL
uniref:ATP-dependent zinc metalloprotease FTSH 10-like n=1 Tax=Rhizophora mucronata TaxID=61149 RepID=A0A2P2JGT1_RHIMU